MANNVMTKHHMLGILVSDKPTWQCLYIYRQLWVILDLGKLRGTPFSDKHMYANK